MQSGVKKLYDSVSGIGNWLLFLIQTCWISLRRLPSRHLLVEQLFSIGVLSLPVVAVTGFATGLVLAAQSFYQLGELGLSGATGLFVSKSMLTEIGPSLTAFMVTGRVGSAICAEIGTMKVTEQIDALKSMDVNPLRYLVSPRILATVLMLPILTIYSALIGIYGGYLISIYVFGMSPQAYFDPMQGNVTLFDFNTGLIKAFVFGILISSISCYKGMTTYGGAAGVGRATTSSVVVCYSSILIVNLVLTIFLNNAHIAFKELVK